MKQTKTLPQSSFFSLMEAMRSYLLTHPDSPCSLPYDIFADPTNEDTPTEDAIHHLEINHHAIFQSRNEFEEQMNAARDRAKQFATERINDYFKQMIEIGRENPMSRHAIVELFSFES